MGSSIIDDARTTKLTQLFDKVVHGRRQLISARDGKLFLEALCLQEDASNAAHKIICGPSGLTALQASMRFDTSLSFLNDGAVALLSYLERPELALINSGAVLQQMLNSIVDPPFFWDAFVKAFSDGLLSSTAARSFAWLLLHLIMLPGKMTSSYLTIAASPNIMDRLLKTPDGETRNLAQRIKKLLPLDPAELHNDLHTKPGGRHDNDHGDYKDINIMPTADELLSRDRPFLRTSDYLDTVEAQSLETVPQIHIDNQFRLLREDMLGEIRDEMMVLTGTKSGHHKGAIIQGLRLHAIEVGTDRKRLPWGIKFQCKDDIPQLKKLSSVSKRLEFLKNNRHVLRQGNMACLFVDDEPVAFPTIYRDEQDLSGNPPLLTLQFVDGATLGQCLFKMKTGRNIKLAQLDSAIFSFEPFLLRLQQMNGIPLSNELFGALGDDDISHPSFQPKQTIKALERLAGQDIKDVIGVKKSITLDDAQMGSLLTCLRQRVSLVQGPPGTGKSFIGALVAKTLYHFTKQVILVVCFTNHALDQFLEDLMDIGIPTDSMVRLGSKSTDRTRPLMIREQKQIRLIPTQWAQIDKLKQRLTSQEERLNNAFNRYRNSNVSKTQTMEFLEFLEDGLPYFEAFTVPVASDGMHLMGKNNKAIDAFYLLDRWLRNQRDAGIFKEQQSTDPRVAAIWEMTRDRREAAQNHWRSEILNDLITEIRQIGKDFNEVQSELNKAFAERDAMIIQNKRIIACTTNGAAKYSSAIQSSSPGIVLVEEAGEILEAHILTSMGLHTEQLIMIGDHKQLRPKCSYELGVENGEGFDLNRSLFERMILRGFPHVTLTKQHRMRPEISATIRLLTYPDLTDAPATFKRPSLRGFQDNLIFLSHSNPEVELNRSIELRDGRSSSKQNEFEGQMVLKCVRYLAQQGYGSDKIVVLTPYLGQLKLLRDQLAKENDPILNDLDTFDLVRAGLLTDLDTKTTNPSLRISTIDNYQGEESEIVIISLTRSNKSNDIGFMSQPERLNVMLSRARDALIMIGNSDTFMNARKGSAVWRKLFDHLKLHGHVYDGIPVKCERHPSRIAKLSVPADFEVMCPDGGCQEPCGASLKCGVHTCPSSCHQLSDHSKIDCHTVLTQKCQSGHDQSWHCHIGPPVTCSKCERTKNQALRKAQKALEERYRREENLKKHQNEILKLEEQIESIDQSRKDERILAEQQAILAQKRQDLKNAKSLLNSPPPVSPDDISDDIHSDIDAEQTRNITIPVRTLKKLPRSPVHTPTPKQITPQKQNDNSRKSLRKYIKSAVIHNASASQKEWQRQKDQENAHNPAIDKIMDMIGLEDVKEKVLKIKAKVETAVRQGTDLRKERLGLVLLGNPGTGKTTVARHYADVLTSLNVLSGSGFVETTGARLAHGGVKEVKDHLEQLNKLDGGVYFIDEAYQLAEGHNYGGKIVLDFLLTEIENLMGRIVFVFAGYTREMEKFFEHNTGLASRIPHRLIFNDYKDSEFLAMLQSKMSQFYQPDLKIEDGPDGLYMNIAVRRLGRGRGREGFGNARDLENVFQKIRDQQVVRLQNERLQGLTPDDFYFAKEDLIGPDPSVAIKTCDAWTDLQQLIGLKTVKDSVQTLIDLISTNYQREIKNLNLITTSLNRVFLGSPGTGKTTVAKLFGQILAHIGVLTKGEVVVKNPADFIGAVIGESEQKTKAILASTIGKVLIIDEAYMLYSGSSASNGSDTFRTAVIDTIVAEVQNVPGDDRCVLLCGYEPQMETMFQHVNPGLARRFQLKEAFRFADFNDDELEQILRLKLKMGDLRANSAAISTAIDVLSRARNGLNFGNGGDVENLISTAKINFQARQSLLPVADRSIEFCFEPQDFDQAFDRAAGAETNLDELFKDVIGCEDIVQRLRQTLQFANGLKANGEDARKLIPMNFVFKGPPGTGKTTTARKFGQVFYDLGFLSAVEVVECSATDMIGQYIGQTGPKTLAQMERGLGKVLFIDEAYRLAAGNFAQEAMDELVGLMTQDKFKEKMIIILAGYDGDMDKLLEINQGLRSRFSEDIFFKPLTPGQCLEVLWSKLARNNINLPNRDLKEPQILDLQHSFKKLSSLQGWGNARDIETLAKRMVQVVYSTVTVGDPLDISLSVMLKCTNDMLKQKMAGSKHPRPTPLQPPAAAQPDHQQPPMINSSTSTSADISNGNRTPDRESDDEFVSFIVCNDENNARDDGVTDQIWAELQLDVAEAQERAKTLLYFEKKMQDSIHLQKNLDALENHRLAKQRGEDRQLAMAAVTHRRQEEETATAIRDAIERATQDKNEEIRIQAEIAAKSQREAKALREADEQRKLQELMKLREQERLKAAKERDEQEKERRRIQAQLELMRENKRRDEQVQKKLAQMGVCVAGYRWIKQADGYRCAGGIHFVSDRQLGI